MTFPSKTTVFTHICLFEWPFCGSNYHHFSCVVQYPIAWLRHFPFQIFLMSDWPHRKELEQMETWEIMDETSSNFTSWMFFVTFFSGAPSRCSEPFSDRGRWVGTCFNHSIRRTWLVLVVTEISTSLSPLNDNEVRPRLRNLHILGPSLPSFEERWIAYEFWINLRSALDYLMKNGEIDIYLPAIASKNK